MEIRRPGKSKRRGLLASRSILFLRAHKLYQKPQDASVSEPKRCFIGQRVRKCGAEQGTVSFYGSLWPFEVHIHILVMRSHYARVYRVSNFLYRINATCGEITSLFLLVVRSIACSTYLCREVDVTAGQLACHHKYQGMLP